MKINISAVNLPAPIKRNLGPILIVIAALLWSLDAIVRSELRTVPPVFLVTLEHTLGFLPLIPWFIAYRKQIMAASTSAKIALLVTSILSGALGTIFYTAALGQVQFAPFSVVVLLQQLQPIFVIALSGILLKEKISGRFLVNAAFALVGAYLISFPTLLPNLTSAPGVAQALAAVLALAAAFSWGSGTIFSKFALKEIDYRGATAARFLITIITGLILSFALRQTMPLNLLSSTQIWQLIVIVFTSGMVALVIYYRGLRSTQAKVSTFAELSWPLSVFAIDLLRGVSFAPTQLLGAVLLVVMILKIVRMQNEERK